MSRSKREMMDDDYFYEFPFVTIEEPRPLEVYDALFESAIQDYGFYIYRKEEPEIKWDSKARVFPFKGAFKAFMLKNQVSSKPSAILFLLIALSALMIIGSIVLLALGYLYEQDVLFMPILELLTALLISIYLTIQYKEDEKKLLKNIILWSVYTLYIAVSIPFIIQIADNCCELYIEEYWYQPVIVTLIAIYYIVILVKLLKKSPTQQQANDSDSYEMEFVYYGVVYQTNRIPIACEDSGNYFKKDAKDAKAFLDYDKIELKVMMSFRFSKMTKADESLELIDNIKEHVYSILATRPVTINYSTTTEPPKVLPLAVDTMKNQIIKDTTKTKHRSTMIFEKDNERFTLLKHKE